MTIKAVVFDIGNVLLEWHPEAFYDARIGAARRQAFFDAVPITAMNEAVDLGASMKDSVYALAEAHPDWRDEILLWHDSWLEIASPEIPHSSRLLRALRARGVPVLALSNFGVETFEIAQKAYPVLTEFDELYVSGHMAVMKPDPVIYQRLEEGSGYSGGELLFADDRADNIEAALARGWQAHLFEHPQGWADRLVTEGLLSREEAA